MMKAIFLNLVLLLFVWSPILIAETSVTIGIDPKVSLAVVQALNEEARELIKDWNHHFSVPINSQLNVEAEFVEPWKVSAHGARTSGTKILLNQKISQSQLRQIFRHELVHVLLNLSLDREIVSNLLIQEALSLLISGDDRRLRRENRIFSTQVRAFQYLKKRNFQMRNGDPVFLKALAVLLQNKQVRESLFLHARQWIHFPQSRSVDSHAKTKSFHPAEFQIISILSQEEVGRPIGPISYLLMDGITGEILASQGRIEQNTPVGSILKPLFLRLYPEMLAAQVPQRELSWACPALEKATQLPQMTWQQALSLSCNGFFLTGNKKKLDWLRWAQHLLRMGIEGESKEIHSAEDAMGLSTQLKLNLVDVANVYREIDQTQPEIIRALHGTLQSGTLSGLEETGYFRNLGAQLKTGSVRSLRGRPLYAWIAGKIGSLFVVARGEGRGGYQLLSELKPLIEPWLSIQFRPTQVQVLGLIPEALVEIGCVQGLLQVGNREMSRVTSSQLQPNDRLHCLAGGLRIRFPPRQGFITERKYFGQVRYDPPPPEKISRHVRVGQARARRGSAFILETSERSYVSRVLAAEMGKGRKETLKSLAYLIRQNLLSDRHHLRPICDTTHCQVFGTADWAQEKVLARFAHAYDAIADLAVVPGRMLHFSKGGGSPWREVRFVSHYLSLLPGEFSFKENDSKKEWNQSASDCEKLRNDLRLPSCPLTVQKQGEEYIFTGRGEGHGLGMDLSEAEALAASGQSYQQILHHFFPSLKLREIKSYDKVDDRR